MFIWQLLGIAIAVLIAAGMWKVFVKAGQPGWAAIIPFYNTYILFKITWGKGWKFLLLLIPIAAVAVLACVYLVMLCIRGFPDKKESSQPVSASSSTAATPKPKTTKGVASGSARSFGGLPSR